MKQRTYIPLLLLSLTAACGTEPPPSPSPITAPIPLPPVSSPPSPSPVSTPTFVPTFTDISGAYRGTVTGTDGGGQNSFTQLPLTFVVIQNDAQFFGALNIELPTYMKVTGSINNDTFISFTAISAGMCVGTLMGSSLSYNDGVIAGHLSGDLGGCGTYDADFTLKKQ